MKKIVYLIVLMIMCITITGCGKDNTKKLECSVFNEGTNMNAYGDLTYYFKDDKLISAEFKVSFKDITIDNLDSMWDYLVKQFDEQNPKVDEVGYKKYSTVDNKKHEYYVTAEIDFEKISKETIEKYGIDDAKGKSMEEIKKDFMDANPNSKATCK